MLVCVFVEMTNPYLFMSKVVLQHMQEEYALTPLECTKLEEEYKIMHTQWNKENEEKFTGEFAKLNEHLEYASKDN